MNPRLAKALDLLSHDLSATGGIEFRFVEAPPDHVGDKHTYVDFWAGDSGRQLRVWPGDTRWLGFPASRPVGCRAGPAVAAS